MKTYLEKLKDPRWQKLRLEIFKRDKWTCRICKSKDKTLSIHHRYYKKGAEPWEYPKKALVTLCEKCHKDLKERMKRIKAELKRIQSKIYPDKYTGAKKLAITALEERIELLKSVN